MELLANYYTNLFTTEIVVFGIITAAFFVFVQIVYSQYSYREVASLFRNVFLILYFIVSILTLLVTALGSLLISLVTHDIVSKYNFNSDLLYIENEHTAIGILILFFVSLFLFVCFVISNIKYLRPSRIALLMGNKVKNSQIALFLVSKYGVPDPNAWMFLPRLQMEVSDNSSDGLATILNSLEEEKKPKKLSKKEEELLKKNKKEAKLESSKKQVIYERIKKDAERATNPLEAINDFILKAILKADIKALEEALETQQRISRIFIDNNKDNARLKEWSPFSGIVEKYINYLVDTYSLFFQMCDRERLDVVKLKIIKSSSKILQLLLPRKNESEIKHILNLWKSVADQAIGESSQVFKNIIQLYKSAADYGFEKEREEYKRILDEVFRHLGWLSERLLSKKGIEKKPIIWDDNYSNEYDELFNVVLSYGYEYNHKHPNAYPLIFFDAVHVIFMRLIKIYKKTNDQDIKNNIFSCVYVYSSFAKRAMSVGNSRGAGLATMELNKCYKKLACEKLDDSANDTMGLLIDVGVDAAGNKQKLKSVEFLRKPIDEYVMDIIESNYHRNKTVVKNEISEAYMKGEGDRDEIWKFITTLGARMGTNFGFMFDWQTGQLYSKDDPRRK